MKKLPPAAQTVGPHHALCPSLSIIRFMGAPTRSLFSHDGVPDRVWSARSDGAEFYHVVRVKVCQLEPILGTVRGREQIVFLILPAQGGQQIFPHRMRLLFRLDRSLTAQ